MRFLEAASASELAKITFEVDPETEFSEQFVAINALGAYTLRQDNPKDKSASSYLAVRIRSAKTESGAQPTGPPEKPQEVSADLSPLEADTLVNALRHYAGSTDFDLDNFAMMHNYQAVSTRVVEGCMAEAMGQALEAQFLLDPVPLPIRPVVGFGVVLVASQE
jgi:hypothetical protein